MVQHKIKVKSTLPAGAKGKVKKTQKKQAGVPKRGHALFIAPKKSNVINQNKVSSEVSKVINDKNEEMVRGRADTAQGKSATASKKK